MSEMDTDSEGESASEEYAHGIVRYPLHNAIEVGDLDTVRQLLRLDRPMAMEKEDNEEESTDEGFYHPQSMVNIDEKDNFYCTPLHIALHEGNLDIVRAVLEAKPDLHKKSETIPVLIVPLSLGSIAEHRPYVNEVVPLLLEAGANVNDKDDALMLPIHIAAMNNLSFCLELLLSKEEAVENVNKLDRAGYRPIHYTARGGHIECLKLLIEKGNAKYESVTSTGLTILHIAAYQQHWDMCEYIVETYPNLIPIKSKIGSKTAAEIIQTNSGGVLNMIPENIKTKMLIKQSDAVNPLTKAEHKWKRMALLTDGTFFDHRTHGRHKRQEEPPPENPLRLKVLIDPKTGILRGEDFCKKIEWEDNCTPAPIGDVLRIHDLHYLRKVSKACSLLDPNVPMSIGNLDSDTAISYGSLNAAFKAAGAVIDAVDRVMKGDNSCAFCAVRPPGHHAGSKGMVKGPGDHGSHGFCLLNNVAIGAAYAMSTYRNQEINKVAIIDFDVHHGNGTEEVVSNLLPRLETERNIDMWGKENISFNTVYKPWKDIDDPKNVFFCSIHGFGGDNPVYSGFYPGTGETLVPPMIDDQSINILFENRDLLLQSRDPKPKMHSIMDVGMKMVEGEGEDTPKGTSRYIWRQTVREQLLPRLTEFDPDMIFISAGFDAHKRDVLNHGFIGIVEEDYHWITSQLMKIGNTCCEGRVISVLEGGYRIQGGITSNFARSVASHVRAMMEKGESCFEMYQSSETEEESGIEETLQQKKIEKLESEIQASQLQCIESYTPEQMQIIQNELLKTDENKSDSIVEIERNESSGTSGRKRRSATVPVDYVALDKKMREETEKQKQAELKKV